jgi:SAM-dependent methyltransferase
MNKSMPSHEIKSHLGGHQNRTNIDVPVFDFIATTYDVKHMVDIGCGPGGMKELAEKFQIEWFGIDGDESIITNSQNTLCHDFTTGVLDLNKNFDLAWSVEFLEHVEEQFIPNFMPVFSQAKYALVTAALPGSPGHHHVNCQTNDYWIKIFQANGFTFLEKETIYLRSISEMTKSFFKKTGMFFVKECGQ